MFIYLLARKRLQGYLRRVLGKQEIESINHNANNLRPFRHGALSFNQSEILLLMARGTPPTSPHANFFSIGPTTM
jgi:hypothetical protein